MIKPVILKTEIFDNTSDDENGNIQISEISVGVWLEFEGEEYCLDFQTTTTYDYGAYSSTLESYDENPDHENLSKRFADDDALSGFLESVKEISDAESAWSDYANKNYKINDEHYDGMDARSEVNLAIPRGGK